MFILSLLQSSLIVEMQEMSAGAAHQTVGVTTAAGNKVKIYIKLLINRFKFSQYIVSHTKKSIQWNIFGQCHPGPFKGI